MKKQSQFSSTRLKTFADTQSGRGAFICEIDQAWLVESVPAIAGFHQFSSLYYVRNGGSCPAAIYDRLPAKGGTHMSSRLVLCALLLFAADLEAQVATGTIVGVVQDATGALVPNAQITIVHVATSESRQTRSNERGEFSLPYVHIGEYTVSAEAAGFKKKTLTGIELKVDQTANLRIGLEVGGVSESVEVVSSAPLVESSTSSLGQVIENRKILDLPLNGRNTFALGLLAGNTSPVAGMSTNLPFVAGGGRFAMNDVMLDGVDDNTSINNGNVGRNGIAYTPSVDAVQEFKVKTNNFSAEFGRSAGAIISAAIKSGGNQLHGSVFEFLRNEKLDANNFFSNAARVDRQPFKQNQFGFTVGGPVQIPKLYNGKNRTFFFGDYQGTRRHTSASSNILDIPPVDFRKGDFSKLTQTLFDPRRSQLNLRLTKMLGLGGTRRLRASVDLYNVLNANDTLTLNGSYGRAWQRPLSILDARIVEFSANLTF